MAYPTRKKWTNAFCPSLVVVDLRESLLKLGKERSFPTSLGTLLPLPGLHPHPPLRKVRVIWSRARGLLHMVLSNRIKMKAFQPLLLYPFLVPSPGTPGSTFSFRIVCFWIAPLLPVFPLVWEQMLSSSLERQEGTGWSRGGKEMLFKLLRTSRGGPCSSGHPAGVTRVGNQRGTSGAVRVSSVL